MDELIAIKDRAWKAFCTLPGVHAVGIGRKVVGGMRTDEIALVVCVTKKLPLEELAADAAIPPRFEHVVTDVVERQLPRPMVAPAISVAEKAIPNGKQYTLTTSQEPPPLGFMIVMMAAVTDTGGRTEYYFSYGVTNGVSHLKEIVASFYGMVKPIRTDAIAGPPTSVQVVLVEPSMTMKSTCYVVSMGGITASVGASFIARAEINISGVTGSDYFECFFAGPARPRPGVLLHARVIKVAPLTSVVVFGGEAPTAEYGVFVDVNAGGFAQTFGVFHNPKRKESISDIAHAISTAINKTPASLRGLVSATAGGPKVTIEHAQLVEVFVKKDIRVGQPFAIFGTSAPLCCNSRIGRIVAARTDLDLALVHLDPGINHKRHIEGLDAVASLARVVSELNSFLSGWVTYDRHAQCRSHLQRLDEWVRHRLRCAQLKQRKRAKPISDFLRAGGVPASSAWKLALSGKGWWRKAAVRRLTTPCPSPGSTVAASSTRLFGSPSYKRLRNSRIRSVRPVLWEDGGGNPASYPIPRYASAGMLYSSQLPSPRKRHDESDPIRFGDLGLRLRHRGGRRAAEHCPHDGGQLRLRVRGSQRRTVVSNTTSRPDRL